MKEFESTAKAVVRQCRNLRIKDGIHHDLARQSRDRIEEWPQRTQGAQIGIGRGEFETRPCPTEIFGELCVPITLSTVEGCG